MQNNNISKALTYVGDEPDIQTLRFAYEETVTELESYFDLCRTSYDDRRNWWPGKSRDHRKHGRTHFRGKVQAIASAILLMNALQNLHRYLFLHSKEPTSERSPWRVETLLAANWCQVS